MPSGAAPARLRSREYLTGPKLRFELSELMPGVSAAETEGATWRGWVLGFLLVALIALTIPYLDFVIPPTIISNSLFPSTSTVILFVLLMGLNLAVVCLRSTLGLTRQDLVLVFCMTMLTNAIPGCGFWSFWAPMAIGGQYFATPENNWELAVKQLPAAWTLKDAGEYRPVEWFYMGLPNLSESFWGRVQQVPWGAWVKPYLIWCAALCLMLSVMFALCGLLQRQWSDHERLAFPIAQLPEELVSGVGTRVERPFLKDAAAWWGIGLVLAFYSLNHLAIYFHQFPQIPVRISIDEYLTEKPWGDMRPVILNIWVSMIGLSYLLSLEVSFSIWFYLLVHKVCGFFMIQTGIAENAWAYLWQESPGYCGVLRGQGTGALLMLALLGFWMARGDLKRSFRQALGLEARERGDTGFSPQTLWLMLFIGLLGSLIWLLYWGMPLLAALLAVGVLVLILTALTRLFCEAGLFFMQVNEFPSRLVMQALPPAALGPGPLVQLNVWNRAMMSDWFRVAFMPVMMNSLHLAARTGLTKRGAMAGMMGAVALALGVSFFSVLYTAYTRPGGANTMAHYYFNDFPHGEYATLTRQVRQIESYQRKLAETGGKLKPEEVPDVARRDRVLIAAEGVGAGYLALTLWLRSFVFWWPHPIGYVMWMANWPHYNTWFAFFVGWCLKKAILKYGGSRVYLRAKRFFIGLVVGEALGVIFWKIVAVWTNTYSDFSMLPT